MTATQRTSMNKAINRVYAMVLIGTAALLGITLAAAALTELLPSSPLVSFMETHGLEISAAWFAVICITSPLWYVYGGADRSGGFDG